MSKKSKDAQWRGPMNFRPRVPTNMRLLRVAGVVIAMLSVNSAFAAEPDERIATDRPDFVESADVVGTGVFQLETSIAFERNTQQGANLRTWTTPTLLRYGISKTLELRLETDGFTHQTASGIGGQNDLQSGMSDTSLGVKWHLSDGDDKGSAATALLLHVDLDSGSSAFRRNGTAVSLRGVAEWELPGDSSLGLMGGVVFDRDETGERFQSGILAVTFSKPLADNVRGFVELAGRSLTEQRFGGNVITFDTGVTYAVGKDMQWDVSAAFGLNKETPDYAVGIGFSIRFR
jgi:hypothetical protein